MDREKSVPQHHRAHNSEQQHLLPLSRGGGTMAHRRPLRARAKPDCSVSGLRGAGACLPARRARKRF